MRGVVVAALVASFIAPAYAADTPPSDQTGAPTDASRGVIAYPASFFATMGLDTAYDMVLRVPGFSFDDGSAARGFAGAAGNVLIDGQRPASKTDDLVGILKRIPSAQVERIDLVRGGAPGIDMQGKTIVVNVIRRKDSGFHGVVTVAAYKPEGITFDPQIKLEGTWGWDDRVLEASLLVARYHDTSQTDGPHDVFGPAGDLLDSSRMDNRLINFQYIATSAYETPLFGGRFRVNLTLEDQPYDKFNIDNFQIAGRQVERERDDQTDMELGQHYERDLGSTLKLELLGLEHLNKNGFASTFDTLTDSQDFSLDDHGGEVIARGILHWRPSDSLTVDSGGEFADTWLDTRTVFTDNGTAVAIPAADVLVRELRGEAFATATWRPSATITVETGIRGEVSTISSSGDVVNTRSFAYPKPRLLATWSPDAQDQVRVRIEREVGQLDFNNFTANAALNGTGIVAGNPTLSPQRDWAFEAAYDRHFWTDGVASLTAREMILQDVVDRVPVFASSGVFDEPGNIGGGTETDLVASFSLPLERLGLTGATLRGAGTWRASQVTDPTTGLSRAISGQHRIDAELHFSQDLPALRVNWGIDFYTGFLERYYRFDEIDSTYTGGYNRIFVEYKPLPDLALRVETYTPSMSYNITRQVFGGPRNIDPLQFTDFQNRGIGILNFFRIRKTFD